MAWEPIDSVLARVAADEGDPDGLPDNHVISVIERRVSVDVKELVQNNIATDTYTLDLDSEWEGITPVVIFGDDPGVQSVYQNGPTEIPAIIMANIGSVAVSVTGYDESGEVRLVTVAAPSMFNVVKSGLYTGEEPPAQGDTLLGQLVAAAGSAISASQQADASASAADAAAASASKAEDELRQAAEDGDFDGDPAVMQARNVVESQTPTFTLSLVDKASNTYAVDVGLPRGADGKSVDIQGGVYEVSQLPAFASTPVNSAFVVNDYVEGQDVRYDLYIRGFEEVPAEQGGPWTIVEDWQGMPGFSLRFLVGLTIPVGSQVEISAEDVSERFTPSAHVTAGDLVIDTSGTLGVVSGPSDSGSYTVTYKAVLDIGVPEGTVTRSQLVAGEGISIDVSDPNRVVISGTFLSDFLKPSNIKAGTGISVTVDGNDITIQNTQDVPTPLDFMPVGTVFEVKQSVSTQDPAAMFGGSWVLDTDTYLFAGIKRYWRTA